MKVRYKEFKTGEEVAELYAADNIIQIILRILRKEVDNK